MTLPKRIQRKRTKGWRMPVGAVNVTRPTIWGNPFIHADPGEAVAAYRKLTRGGTSMFEMGPGKLQFAKNAHPQTLHWHFSDFVRENIHKLRGKDLACWCPLDAPCHADVLLHLANKDT
tara:strand:+ start:590 stop:946 length:357 start_codon:yes stop_codon:yes gene_type:complete